MRDNRTGYARRPDGQRQGQGWWWENRVAEAIQKWGQPWRTATREHILGCEVDIIATGPVVDDTVIRLVVQCKDWRDKPVPPSEIYRLIALAIPCKAYPVIAHTGGFPREHGQSWTAGG